GAVFGKKGGGRNTPPLHSLMMGRFETAPSPSGRNTPPLHSLAFNCYGCLFLLLPNSSRANPLSITIRRPCCLMASSMVPLAFIRLAEESLHLKMFAIPAIPYSYLDSTSSVSAVVAGWMWLSSRFRNSPTDSCQSGFSKSVFIFILIYVKT